MGRTLFLVNIIWYRMSCFVKFSLKGRFVIKIYDGGVLGIKFVVFVCNNRYLLFSIVLDKKNRVVNIFSRFGFVCRVFYFFLFKEFRECLI